MTDAKALSHLGLVALRAGRTGEAMQQFQRALAIDPHHIPTLTNLATLHAMTGDMDKAIPLFEAVIRSRPNSSAFENLALIHLSRGDVPRAVPVLVQGLRSAETPKMRELFVSCVADMRAVKDQADLRGLATRALAESWGPPSALVKLAASLIKVQPEIAECMARAAKAWPRRLPAAELFGGSGLASIAAEPLLLNLLEATHIADVELERFLAAVRTALLELANKSETPADPGVLRFQGRAGATLLHQRIRFPGHPRGIGPSVRAAGSTRFRFAFRRATSGALGCRGCKLCSALHDAAGAGVAEDAFTGLDPRVAVAAGARAA